MIEELPEYPGIVELVRCFESAAAAADELERFFGDNPDFADNLQTRVAELEAFQASVPWDDLYTCIVIAANSDATGDDRQAIVRAASWHDLNDPEAQP